jgi:hypothetical protein
VIGNLKEMGVTMALVDPMEEKGITERLVTETTIKAKDYFEVLITGCQVVIAGIHKGIKFLVSWMHNTKIGRAMGEIEDNFDQYESEYATLREIFMRHVILSQYCGIKFKGRPREFHRWNYDLGRMEGKMEIPPFDGIEKLSTKAWVQNLDAYLQLNPMVELDAIKFATFYLEGKSHEWWFHGMNNLGHDHIISYIEFT